MKLAIIGGIAEYKYQPVLDACRNDADTLRGFLDATKEYADICFLGPGTTASEAKNLITEFVKKHRGEKVEELFFYFSGHGDRIEEDFFYALSDYKSDRPETTGLRNSELDSLIRNFSPELTIKIVDACYSGSTYIKSDDDIIPAIKKSANDNELKKLYFLYSSAGDQTSWAGPKFSHFTLALFQTLAERSGPVRYRDLIAAVADEMNSIGAPKPTFVMQADNLETFVNMDVHLSDLLKLAVGVPLPGSANSGVKNFNDGSETGEDVGETEIDVPGTLPLAELAAIKARDIYCTEEEARDSIKLLESTLDYKNWPEEVTNAYEHEVIFLNESIVPNKQAIAKWIQSVKDDSVFATPTFEAQKYEVEEYREVPKKPSQNNPFGAIAQMQKLFGEDKQYKLVSVKKERQVIAGFRYTDDPVALPRKISFLPRHPSLEQYAAIIVFMLSRRGITCLYSIEHLPYTGWDTTQPPMAINWKQLYSPLKNRQKISELAKVVIYDISAFISTDARQRLS